MWWKKHKWKVILPVVILAALAAAFFFGGRSGGDAGTVPSPGTALEAAPTESPETAPTEAPAAAPATGATAAPEGNTVTFSISCAAIWDHMDWLDPDKTELVPEDGWILSPVTLTLEEGDSVFDLLLRVTREKKIHMEYSDAPLYGSAYIEGIANLYEFDCGEVSGWMYCVNGWYPNYGCSGYYPEPGDVIEWRFTCNGGDDIGGGYMEEAVA